MSYIVKEKRSILDQNISDLLETLRGMQCDDPDNDDLEANLSYVISTVLARLYRAGYKDIVRATGLLVTVKDEYYRRVGAPYENQKSFENGDVYDVPTAEELVDLQVRTVYAEE